MKLPIPLRIGWESVKVNVVPMVVLWLVALLVLLGYYHFRAVANVLEPLSRLQTECGWRAAFASRMFFCGLVPGFFLLTVRPIRPRRVLLTILAYSLWAGLWGVICDLFCKFQALWFGEMTTGWAVVFKTLVDQFVFTVLFSTPLNVLFFSWVAQDFSVRRMAANLPRHVLRDACLPMLIATWAVWLPTMYFIYQFPVPLQIQLIGLVGAYWMLIGLGIGRAGYRRGC